MFFWAGLYAGSPLGGVWRQECLGKGISVVFVFRGLEIINVTNSESLNAVPVLDDLHRSMFNIQDNQEDVV